MKSLPKSLHTVTVLVRLCNAKIEARSCPSTGFSRLQAMREVLDVLGYTPSDDPTSDPYGLVEQALKQLEAR